MKQQPALFKELFFEAGCHLRFCVHNIENIALSSAYARVTHHLLFFCREFGSDVGGGTIRLDMPLTHQDLADILGTTRETVSLAMGQLRSKGILHDGRTIIVSSLEHLANEAYA